jgi:hypothetical protein
MDVLVNSAGAGPENERAAEEALLKQRRKGDRAKVALAKELRAAATMPLSWVAGRLGVGSQGYLAWLLSRREPRARAKST